MTYSYFYILNKTYKTTAILNCHFIIEFNEKISMYIGCKNKLCILPEIKKDKLFYKSKTLKSSNILKYFPLYLQLFLPH